MAKDPRGAGSDGVARRLAVIALAAMAGGALVVFGDHLLAWLGAGSASAEDGGYARFVVAPIVAGAGVGLAAACLSTVLAFVLPRRLVVSWTLVAATAVALAVALGVGFTVSSGRNDPDAALTATVERLRLPSTLQTSPITHTLANNDAPAVQTSWHGGVGSLGCTTLTNAVEDAYPGATVEPGMDLHCALVVAWHGTTILIDPYGVDSSHLVDVQLIAYLTY